MENEDVDANVQEDSDAEGSSESCSEEEIDEDGGAESGQDSDEGSSSANESADEVGFSSDASNGDSDKCPICLQRFTDQEIGVPDNCEHHFCLHCIAQWAKKVTTCPIDRKSFHSIMVKNELNGEIKYVEDVTSRDANAVDWDEPELEQTFCEVCGHSDREDRLLLCDGCDLGYHLECLEPPLEVVPIEDWYCPECQARRDVVAEPQPSTSVASVSSTSRQSSLRVPRTSLSRRIMQQSRMSSSSCHTKLNKPTTGTKKPRKTSKAKPRKTRRKCKSRGGKAGTKSKRRRKKRRVRRGTNASARNPNRCRVAQQMKPTTTKARLAQSLGLILPRSGQPLIGLPLYRPTNVLGKGVCSNRAPTGRRRYHDGIAPSLSLFGSQYDLSECLETVSDDEGAVGVARVQPIHRIGCPRKMSARVVDISPLHLSSTSNVLGPILNSQRMLHVRGNSRVVSTPVSSTSEKFYGFPPVSLPKDGDNDSSGYDSARGNGEFPNAASPSSRNQNVPFLTATGGNSSTIRPSVSSNSESRNTDYTSNVGNSAGVAGSGNSFSSSAPNTGISLPSQGPRNDADSTQYFQTLPIEHATGTDPKKKLIQESDPDAKATDEDDDYNIYSDIEEEQKEGTIESLTEDLFAVLSQDQIFSAEDAAVDKGKDRDSDSDMVIDEGQVGKVSSSERVSRSSAESLSQQVQTAESLKLAKLEDENKTSRVLKVSTIRQSLLPIDSDSDSQESIPLPDSTPPPSCQALSEGQDNQVLLPESSKTSVKKDEYDPSQPLTSSEEEDENLGVIIPPKIVPNQDITPSKKLVINLRSNSPKLTLAPTPPKEKKKGRTGDSSSDDDLDLSSIPMPSEEYRRPTIQFSIPTRHRLIPISSLIKRQKGVVRKENRESSQSFQSEISKAFGGEKDDEGGEDGTTDEAKVETEANIEAENLEKGSLVAEIFGSDDDDGQDVPIPPKPVVPEPNLLNKFPSLVGDHALTQTSASAVVPMELDNSAEKKWKKIAEDQDPPQVATSSTNKLDEPYDDDVTIINENVEIVELSRRSAVAKSPSVVTAAKPAVKQGLSGHVENVSNEVPEVDNSASQKVLQKKRDKPTDNLVTSNDTAKAAQAKKVGKEKDVGKDLERKQHRRKRSGSANSIFEEGEIDESPDKMKRRGKKTKKSKHRRNKDADSDSASLKDNLSDKQGRGPYSSSSEDDGRDRDGIPWKKPSRSTKERNYRDGKPKTDEKLFREKEKRREASNHTERRKKGSDGAEISTASARKKSKEKDKMSDVKRGYRRSVSKSRSRSPPAWRSTSRSVSKSKRRRSNSVSSNRSLGSRSPSRHSYSRSPRSRRWKRKRRHSASSRRGHKSRSRSRSPARIKSRSPKRSRISRRSRSLSSRERKSKVRRRSVSTSSYSEDRSGSPRGKNRRKSNAEDKVTKKNKKDKEKVLKDKTTPPDQQQVKEKDKDKKRKKRKREKSVSPAKEIFTDGDSIVVSLNFQKGKDAANSNAAKEATAGTSKHENDQTERKRKSKHARKSSTERDKPLKKTILIDLESSPVQEVNIGESPAVIVVSDDEEYLMNLSGSSPAKSGRGKETSDRDGVAVSTTSLGVPTEGNAVSPSYRHGVAADSTQIQPRQNDSHPSPSKFTQNSMSAEDRSSSSPTRGDAMVTSSRDSVEIPLPQDDDTHSSSSPQPPQINATSPLTPPLPPGTPPRDSIMTIEKDTTTSPAQIPMGQNHPLNLPPPPGMSIGLGSRPLGIGNIPGLFSSSSLPLTSTGIGGVSTLQPPIVIPTPPPQIRFNTAVQQQQFNANMIASVATALYAPFMAAKQLQHQQQQLSHGGRFPTSSQPSSSNVGNMNRSGDRQSQGTVLLPKNQNSHSSSNRRLGAEGGDSPFSPNSSEGDDLFDPPTEKSQSRPSATSASGYGTLNQDKNDRSSAAGNSAGGSAHGDSKPKTLKLFDTLFGAPAVGKRPSQGPTQSTSHPNKSSNPLDKSAHSKLSHHKSKGNKKGPPHKKEIVKLSEGELRLSEDVPTSAVELRVKEKFLKKLNRQERVEEEVKLSLKPHYSKKHVNKDEYKEILRRAVPKICHNKSGEINPYKIKELVEAYVKKFRKNRKN